MGAFARCSDEGIDAKVDCIDGQVNTTMDLVWNSVSQSCEGDATITSNAACVGTYQLVEFRERNWKSDDMNFDNIFNAMETLFEMSTTEGWTAVMYNGVDSRSPELAPVRDHNPPVAFFFVIFEIVANFFILNLFVGIILDNFAQISQESGDGSSATMTKSRSCGRCDGGTLRREGGKGARPPSSPGAASRAARTMSARVVHHGCHHGERGRDGVRALSADRRLDGRAGGCVVPLRRGVHRRGGDQAHRVGRLRVLQEAMEPV